MSKGDKGLLFIVVVTLSVVVGTFISYLVIGPAAILGGFLLYLSTLGISIGYLESADFESKYKLPDDSEFEKHNIPHFCDKCGGRIYLKRIREPFEYDPNTGVVVIYKKTVSCESRVKPKLRMKSSDCFWGEIFEDVDGHTVNSYSLKRKNSEADTGEITYLEDYEGAINASL